MNNVCWPTVRPLKTPCYRHAEAGWLAEQPSRSLRWIAANLHHDVDAEIPNALACMALIDRVLEDRRIDTLVEEWLVAAAWNWQLSRTQLGTAHAQYLHSLCVAALVDGVISAAERRDFHLVGRLLGRDLRALDDLLNSASRQLATARSGQPKRDRQESSVTGQSVC
ncbi:MAG: hypothetical protein ACKOGA_17975 [Planctomycetaceae bacterium]